MAIDKESFQFKWAKMVSKAWEDPAFKKKLLSNPQAVLKEEGMKIPADVKNIKIVENTADTWTFVIPHKESFSQELKKVSGGGNPGMTGFPQCYTMPPT